MKTCFKCGIEKSLDEFYKHSGMTDGHLGKCKECTKSDVSNNYSQKRDQYAEYEKSRFHRPERKEQRLGSQKRRRQRDPQKYSSHAKVRRAIKKGTLIPQPCEVCQTSENIEAHHDDYSKPLDVRWLCFQHHREHHGQTVNI